jgi:hypothetical protein
MWRFQDRRRLGTRKEIAMNTNPAQTTPITERRDDMRPTVQRMILDCVVIVSLLVPAWFACIALFLFGFLIIPNSIDPTAHVKFGDYSTFVHLATQIQDLVIVVLPVSALVGVVARLLRFSLAAAVGIMFALIGLYWVSLLTVYIAGIISGVFV